MRHYHWKSLALSAALALAVVGTGSIHAQDRPNDQNDQRPAPEHNAQPGDRSRDTARPDESRPDENARPNDNARGNDNERANDHARPAEGGDDAARYRKAHPGAAARCHDGFFTKTTDRQRACSKHGGIDLWLLL